VPATKLWGLHVIGRIVIGIAAVMISAVAARAAELSDSTIVHTIICEAGQVGRELARLKLPLNSKVAVDWTETETTTEAGGVGVSVPILPIGGSGDLSKEDLRITSSNGLAFNLNPASYSACTGYQREIVKGGIGLYDCLFSRKFTSLQVALEEGEGSTGCKQTITVVKKADGNFRIKAFGADVGPSGSYESKHVIEFAFAAPKEKRK
jgi:hypothetical protein